MITYVKEPLKYLATINDEALAEQTNPCQEIQYIDIGNVDSSGKINEITEYRFEDAPSRARRIVRDGDIIISTVRTYLQAIAPIDSPPDNLIVSTGFAVVRSKRERLDASYCKYALLTPEFIGEVVSRSVGISYPAINASDLGNIEVCIPPLSKQRQIAEYLDRETAKIDALIAAKKRLLELLAEKRRSLITHAVTRGLKADVPMQDSGIKSLGDIPAHWNIEHLKYHLFNIEQGWSPQSDNFPADLDEWGVLKVGAVNGWDFNSNENKRIPPELEIPLEYEIRSGDILVSRANTPELVGSASLVKEVRSKLILCDKLYRLIPQGNRLLPEYLVFYLRSSSSRFEFERDASGSSSSMQNISQGTLANLWIPIPPVDEQIQMVTYIKNKLSLIEKLETTARQVIALLQERRTSLISAAVTGQLQITD
jgi:type I restriction enzyme, S subunit